MQGNPFALKLYGVPLYLHEILRDRLQHHLRIRSNQFKSGSKNLLFACAIGPTQSYMIQLKQNRSHIIISILYIYVGFKHYMPPNQCQVPSNLWQKEAFKRLACGGLVRSGRRNSIWKDVPLACFTVEWGETHVQVFIFEKAVNHGWRFSYPDSAVWVWTCKSQDWFYWIKTIWSKTMPSHACPMHVCLLLWSPGLRKIWDLQLQCFGGLHQHQLGCQPMFLVWMTWSGSS